MPLSGFSPLQNGRGQSFKQPANSKAKTFSLTWDRLGTLLEYYQGWDKVDRAEIDSIVLDELYDLGKYVLVPAYHAYAPLKLGMEGATDITVDAARSMGKSGFRSSPITWTHHGKYLMESIQAIRSTEPLGLTIRMPWFGLLTIEGRGKLPDRPWTHPYLIELPGGMVIYSTKVGPATVWPGEGQSPSDRMHWARDAYRAVQKAGWIAQAAANIEIRTFIEVIFPGLKGEAAITQAKAFRTGLSQQYEAFDAEFPSELRDVRHVKFTDYRGLRAVGREGARPAHERLAAKRQANVTTKRLTQHHESLKAQLNHAYHNRHTAYGEQGRAVARLRLRLRRAEDALNTHGGTGTTHIPFGRHR